MTDISENNALCEPSLFDPAMVPCPDMSGKTVIMLPVMYDFKLFKQAFGFTEPAKKLFCAELMLNAPNYSQIVLCGGFIGGPQAVMLLEVLAAKCARNFWFCGLCGALSALVHVGSLFVADNAFSDEGVARHYSSKKVFAATEGLIQRLMDKLAAGKRSYLVGRMASLDALFRETKSKIAYYRGQGCQAIDMETAALYAAAEFHGLNICGLYAVSDVFNDESWQAGFKSRELKIARQDMVEIMKEVCHA